jgi:hypothetical protein
MDIKAIHEQIKKLNLTYEAHAQIELIFRQAQKEEEANG